jgi:hypothetical protein
MEKNRKLPNNLRRPLKDADGNVVTVRDNGVERPYGFPPAHALAARIGVDGMCDREIGLPPMLGSEAPEAREARSQRHEPLARLLSALGNWAAAVAMSSGHHPEITWTLRLLGTKWRLIIVVDGARVFDRESSNTFQLPIDAERDFRSWADESDRKENEAKLDASKDLRRP